MSSEEGWTGRLAAFAITAFKTWLNWGLIPQLKQGANGVISSLAVTGSKLEGTGFEKEHIVQIQVAVLAGVGCVVGR